MAPVNVNVPDPAFVKPPVPELVPENVVELPLPPAVSVPLPKVNVPEPDNAPMVSAKPFTSNVASVEIDTVVELPRTPAAPSLRVPAEMVVVPE